MRVRSARAIFWRGSCRLSRNTAISSSLATPMGPATGSIQRHRSPAPAPRTMANQADSTLSWNRAIPSSPSIPLKTAEIERHIHIYTYVNKIKKHAHIYRARWRKGERANQRERARARAIESEQDVYMFISTCIYMYTYIYVYTYIYMYIYINLYNYIFIYSYIYIWTYLYIVCMYSVKERERKSKQAQE